MQLIRLLGNKEYLFKCSLCTAEIRIPIYNTTPQKKFDILMIHIDGHNHMSLGETIVKSLLEKHGEEV